MQLRVAIVSAEHLERDAVFAELLRRGASKVEGSQTEIDLPINGLDGVAIRFASVQSPGKPRRAQSAFEVTGELLRTTPRYDLAIFVGTAGCLDTREEFPVGQVVVPKEIVWDPRNQEIATAGDEAARVYSPPPAVQALAHDMPSWRSADRLVTVDHVISSADERDRLKVLANKPLLVAMEDAGFMAAAEQAGVPAVAVRAVMDHITDRAASEQKDRNKKLACRRAAESAIELALAYRLEHGFNERYATKIHARRDAGNAEANQEALIEGLIAHVTGRADLQLSLDAKNRVDVVADGLVIEVEKDLRSKKKLEEGLGQIDRYLETAHREGLGVACGFVTDGVEWHFCQRTTRGVQVVGAPFVLRNDETDTRRLIRWLDDRLTGNEEKKSPASVEIERFLGSRSPTRQADRLVLMDLWEELRDNTEAQLKRGLWAQCLGTALGTQFENSDDLFVDHTYLVLLAELIANSVVGVDILDESIPHTRLLDGSEFHESRLIEGVVEADYFDWPLHSQRSEDFVRRLAKRVSQFDWSQLEHDALKHLYESVIDSETRKSLGEYYTPDWLAIEVVNEVVTEPLTGITLDPACGSGTFLFHAVRQYFFAAEEAGKSTSEAVVGVTQHVYGFDLHPVAVALARVTYILAIGQERLASREADVPLQIPVFLADSLRWDVSDATGTFDEGTLTIAVNEQAFDGIGEIVPGTMHFEFPEALMASPENFDNVVAALDKYANGRMQKNKLVARLERAGFAAGAPGHDSLLKTASNLRTLVDQDLDGIWSYYLRNQARPAWLTAKEKQGGGVDTLIGNPPWLRYAAMDEGMKKRFRELSDARNLSTGKRRTGHDLSGLFVARSVELYLRRGGKFGFVMPESVLRGGHFEGLRTGKWSPHTGKGKKRQRSETPVEAVLSVPWDVGKHAESFPFPSAVLLGSRTTEDQPPEGMPRRSLRLNGKGLRGASEAARVDVAAAVHASPYVDLFRQGATIVPRVLTFVVDSPPAPNAPSHLRNVVSARSSLEKKPWKTVKSLTGSVESQFIFDVHLGSTILPFTAREPMRAVLPILNGTLTDDNLPAGMERWWEEVNETRAKYRASKDKMSQFQQLNYFDQLSAQLPVMSAGRVLYAKSGVRMAAAYVEGTYLVNEKLYWHDVESESEGHYLCAFLNSEFVRSRTEDFQSRGLAGPRDFDKYIFVNNIALYDDSNNFHVACAALGARAASLASDMEFDSSVGFQKARKFVREELARDGVDKEIEDAVAELLTSS